MYKLSDQAVGSIMMCLQKGILEGVDITSLIKNFEIRVENNDQLVVDNPPTFKVGQTIQSSEDVDLA